MAKHKKTIDATTEEKIKATARLVFHKKGYAATRTRDIAEEAGINLALLNYYFRSKEKLFEIIMFETLFGFMQNMIMVLSDEKSSLEKKVKLFVSNYIDLIIKDPNIPIFMLSEIRNHPENLLEKLPLKHLIMDSAFVKQHQQLVAEGKITDPNPLHFLMNLISLVVFPFIGQPLLQGISGLNEAQFVKLMQERKDRIPAWIKAMMKTK
ncbi:MAG: TetR/AcrR family transcriptional regulator [Sphingobacteriales bacterium]|jgi:AcrR family transcriptional regulator|nr:TetR/AcrR family transcriptional regulator [Sphingobacteriales bacterium]MBP9140847.1 TetR/AcrR family transcriptional regulator [Chitinophagales bacterium]MDA0199199.1 TetR/AcrR family transcriptional regulator [Bacteroidota bacterium]MBK6891171.1 TetR/AcrR family transcriptional regulator [Sphingobacteriales bacterium]MBK7527005.1 TetR/AcrR family transcriptional regulator [Sphingobacteriales bacterium]